MRLGLLVLSLILGTFYSWSVVASTELDALQKATEFTRSVSVYQVHVQKNLQKSWGGKAEGSEGELYFKEGKFRWETSAPEKVLVVYDGANLWTVRYASPDFPGKNKVIKLKISTKTPERDFLLKLLSTKNWNKEFELKKAAGLELSLEPKWNKEKSGLKDLRVTLSETKDSIAQISFSDDLENRTTLSFAKPNLVASSKLRSGANFFSYNPNPKQDEVEEP
jgi:outer membrane lipoprotein-sorting protein